MLVQYLHSLLRKYYLLQINSDRKKEIDSYMVLADCTFKADYGNFDKICFELINLVFNSIWFPIGVNRFRILFSIK